MGARGAERLKSLLYIFGFSSMKTSLVSLKGVMLAQYLRLNKSCILTVEFSRADATWCNIFYKENDCRGVIPGSRALILLFFGWQKKLL